MSSSPGRLRPELDGANQASSIDGGSPALPGRRGNRQRRQERSAPFPSAGKTASARGAPAWRHDLALLVARPGHRVAAARRAPGWHDGKPPPIQAPSSQGTCHGPQTRTPHAQAQDAPGRKRARRHGVSRPRGDLPAVPLRSRHDLRQQQHRGRADRWQTRHAEHQAGRRLAAACQRMRQAFRRRRRRPPGPAELPGGVGPLALVSDQDDGLPGVPRQDGARDHPAMSGSQGSATDISRSRQPPEAIASSTARRTPSSPG